MTSLTVKVAFRTCRRHDEPVPAPKPTGPTTIARRIALAHHVEALIERGELRDLGHAAERLGITRARMTQLADLALLAPEIQAAVLLGRCEPNERQLRAIGRRALWAGQRRAFSSLFPNALEGHNDRDCNDD